MRRWTQRKLTTNDGERILWHALEYLENVFGPLGERATAPGEFTAITLIRRLLGIEGR